MKRIQAQFVFGLFVALWSFIPAAGAAPKSDVKQRVAERLAAETVTPFQKALKEKVNSRKANGHPVPKDEGDDKEIEYTFAVTEVPDAPQGHVIKATGTTRVTFTDPEKAGHQGNGQAKGKWPDLKVRKQAKVGDQGDHQPVDPPEFDDFTAQYHDAAQAEFARLAGKEGDCSDPEAFVMWKGDCPDEPDRGIYEFGSEPREAEIVEEITFTFPRGSPQATALFRALQAAPAAAPLEQILMGFTYTGPNIDYTIGDTRRVCIKWLGCATIYDIRAGFALDWDLGLRLPGQDALAGPGSLVAGNTYLYTSAVDPLDWQQSDYQANGIGTPENGNEFLLAVNFFAGAKVKVLGADICPYCQYVELDEDYSTSFLTPFGSGETFPIEAFTIPIKSWDYDIVSLELGLSVTPSLGSSSITATAQGTGATSMGPVQITHARPGASGGTVAFPVNACITAGSHEGSVEVRDFRYWFNEFSLGLGAYLNLQVFGYGAWNPTIPLLDLDLSMLSDDLYLGDHIQCDWAFNCGRAGPDDVLTIGTWVSDDQAPVTAIALAGTSGSQGWFRSPVSATLSAADRPAGCGIGGVVTEYGIDEAPASLYAGPVSLPTEGVRTVAYRSRDADGNLETDRFQLVHIDWTPPVISGAPTEPANGFGWYRQDVTVRFVATDAVSGVWTLTPDQVLSAEARSQAVEGTAIDNAGNSAATTVGGINIDKTPAVIAVAGPQAITYQNTDTFTFQWTVADALSGVLASEGRLDGEVRPSGYVPDLLLMPGGVHEVTVEALDQAENLSRATVTFGININIDGLLAATQHVCGLVWITKAGVCNSLESKVMAARSALELGQANDARGVLGAYLNELDAQLYKSIIELRGYELLRSDALYVLSRYGLL